jgi:hypothetical protein
MATNPTGIELICNIFLWPLTFFTVIFRPTVEIDGQPQQVPWRQNHFVPVSAGSHQVVIYWKYFGILKCNKATTQIQLSEGQRVHIEYKTAWLTFLPGKLAVTA